MWNFNGKRGPWARPANSIASRQILWQPVCLITCMCVCLRPIWPILHPPAPASTSTFQWTRLRPIQAPLPGGGYADPFSQFGAQGYQYPENHHSQVTPQYQVAVPMVSGQVPETLISHRAQSRDCEAGARCSPDPHDVWSASGCSFGQQISDHQSGKSTDQTQRC